MTKTDIDILYRREKLIWRRNVCDTLRSVIRKHKEGMYLKDVNKEFREFTGYDVPLNAFDGDDLKFLLMQLKYVYFDKDDMDQDIVMVSGGDFDDINFMSNMTMNPQTSRKRKVEEQSNLKSSILYDVSDITEAKRKRTSEKHVEFADPEIQDNVIYKKTNLLDYKIFDQFCELYPIFFNQQALGDNLFVKIAEHYFGGYITINEGKRTCGLCSEEQTINELLKKVKNAKLFAPRVVILIGNTDIKNNVPVSEMLHDLSEIVQELEQKGVKVTLCTIPRPPSGCNGAMWKTFKTFNFSIKTSPEFKCNIIDLEEYFKYSTHIMEYNRYNLDTQEKLSYHPDVSYVIVYELIKYKLKIQYNTETRRIY